MSGKQTVRNIARRLRFLPRLGPLALLPILLLVVAFHRFIWSPWYDTAPLGTPAYGVDFSCRDTDELGEDCRQTLTAILEQLHPRYLRLAAYWDQVEPRPGVYDFSSIDWQIAEAQSHGARVTLSVGMKGQRWPEYYLPAWLISSQPIPDHTSPADNTAVASAALTYIGAVVAHEAGQPAIEAWQVDNEPLVHTRTSYRGWYLTLPFVQREAATIRAADPRRRPLLITNSSDIYIPFADPVWRGLLSVGDILGESLYPKRQRGPFAQLYLYPYQIGPFTPDLYAQARTAKQQGKQFWISELQAEPYEAAGVRLTDNSTCNWPSLPPEQLRANIQLARRSGAERAYLWGAEWWYYCLTVHHDARFWQIGQEVLHESPR